MIDSIEAFLKINLPAGIEIEFVKGHGAPGILTSPNSATVKGTAEAYERVFNTPCMRILCGATILMQGV